MSTKQPLRLRLFWLYLITSIIYTDVSTDVNTVKKKKLTGYDTKI